MKTRKLSPIYGGHPPYIGKEDALQISCITWLRIQYPDLLAFHVPNGGKRSKAEAGRFKAMGVLAGVPDVLIISARQITISTRPNPLGGGHKTYSQYFTSLAIELKTKGGTVSPNQKAAQEAFKLAGWKVATAYSLDQFQDTVNNYLSNG